MKSFTAITTHSQLFYQTFLSLRFKKTEKKATENKAKQNEKRESRNLNNCVYFNSFLPSGEIPCPTLLPKYLSLIHQYDQHTELYITTLSLTFFFLSTRGRRRRRRRRRRRLKLEKGTNWLDWEMASTSSVTRMEFPEVIKIQLM